jgi:hypothetical protein
LYSRHSKIGRYLPDVFDSTSPYAERMTLVLIMVHIDDLVSCVGQARTSQTITFQSSVEYALCQSEIALLI